MAPCHGIWLASSFHEHFGLWSIYHFHVEDPLRSFTSIQVTIDHGHANDQGNDHSSVAYLYRLFVSARTAPEGARAPRRWTSGFLVVGPSMASGTNDPY